MPQTKRLCFYGGDDVGPSEFLEECFKLGMHLLSKDVLTEEEKQFLNILDEFEKWVTEQRLSGSIFCRNYLPFIET